MRFLILFIFLALSRPTLCNITQNWIPYSKTFGKSFGDIPGEGKTGAVLPLEDGGAILTGYVWNPALKHSNRALIIRVNESGEILWEKYLGNEHTSQTVVSVAGDLNQGFFIGGEIYSPGNFSSDFWYLNLDPDGKIITEKTFGGEGEDTLRKLILSPHGDLYLVGSTIPNPVGSLPSHGWIIKMDRAGKKVWSRSIGVGQGVELNAASIASDGSLIVGGLSRKDFIRLQTQGYLAKINTDGNLKWEKTYGSSTEDVIRSLTIDEGGAILFVGMKEANHNFKGIGWLQKLDEDGHLLYERTFGFRSLNSIQNLPGKGYVIAGVSFRSENANQTGLDAWVAELNHDGRIEWEREIGGDRKDEAIEVIPIKNKGFYLCGATSSYSLPSQKLWLLKLDRLGRWNLELVWSEELQLAIQTGDIQALEEYIKKYPGSTLISKARQLIYSLEEKELTLIERNPEQESYKSFLNDHPESQHATRIKMRLKELEQLEGAIEENKISTFYKFLKDYPQSHFANDIQKRILTLEFREAIKQNSVIKMEKVCSQTLEVNMLQECDEEIYKYYKNKDKIESFEIFLRRFPKSIYIDEARDRFHYLTFLKAMDGDTRAKIDFVEKMNDDRHQNLVLNAIFKEVQKAGSLVGFLGFARRFKQEKPGKEAFDFFKKQLFKKAIESQSIAVLERFQSLFPQSEEFSEAQQITYEIEERQLLETANSHSKNDLDFFENIVHQNKRLANLALEWREPWIYVRKWALMRAIYPFSMTRQVQQMQTEAPLDFKLPQNDLSIEEGIAILDLGLVKILSSSDSHHGALGELIDPDKELEVCTAYKSWLCEKDIAWLNQLKSRWKTTKILSNRLPIRQTKREWLSNRQPEQPLEMPR